jgi:hypothetical protein
MRAIGLKTVMNIYSLYKTTMEVVNVPNRDGTGPDGRGPMTGRGLGPCAKSPGFDRGFGRGYGRGYGRGMGFGRGFGGGFGRGFGCGCPYWLDSPELAPEEEKKILNAELEQIEKEKQSIAKRLKELEK